MSDNHARMQDVNSELQQQQAQLQEQNALLSAKQSQTQDKNAQVQRDIADLENEIVRLTTELTVAKADLEGAYGTRAQRQKEAGVAAGEFEALQDNHRLATNELDQLREQHTLLENELQEMTQEFQEMTRESLELEKERGQLESLIDGLRDRCDMLEGQLADEKVRFIGVKSPAAGAAEGPPVRENMSVMVLRQEFKRMMREARLEGVKLIRVSQCVALILTFFKRTY
jgi:chromosome segregation ATPase